MAGLCGLDGVHGEGADRVCHRRVFRRIDHEMFSMPKPVTVLPIGRRRTDLIGRRRRVRRPLRTRRTTHSKSLSRVNRHGARVCARGRPQTPEA
jgi:hypothetical protein